MPCTQNPHPDVAMHNHNAAARAVNVLGLSSPFRERVPGIEKCSNPEKAIHLLAARIVDTAPVHPAAWAKIKAALGCPVDATSHQVAQAAEVAAELAHKAPQRNPAHERAAVRGALAGVRKGLMAVPEQEFTRARAVSTIDALIDLLLGAS